MLGKLTANAIPTDPIVLGAVGGGAFAILLAIIGITYFKKWGYLWHEWLTSVDHKRIGVMYIFVALVMLLRGFADAIMMRYQLAVAHDGNHGLFPPHHYDQIFTAHGVIMIFFMAMPFMTGLVNIVVPLQIGARDVAFPFVNSLSFWLFVAGVALINLSLALGEFAQTGWLAYPPLSELQFSPGVGVDYYIWSLQISGIGTLLTGVNFLVTIFKMRAPGMTLMRMPVFTWTALITNLLIVGVFPILTVVLALLGADRYLGTHFFTNDGGGNAMMYVNLIWIWGHPEVYILILPAFGVYSEVVATFCSKRLFGYTSMVYATSCIGLLSFLVWLHHFFTMGSGANVNAFFGIATMIISIPTGVKIFNWLFTMFRGRVRFSAAMCWTLGFIITFAFGGMTGVMMAVPAIDFVLHNSLFLIAHFHNAIIGGVVFGYLAGLGYWFPKAFGFKLNEVISKCAFGFWITGFFFAFGPLYILGFLGMTRRLNSYTNPEWTPLLHVALFGAVLVGIGILCNVITILYSIYTAKQNKDVTGDPWDGRTLEWSTSSPAPFYNFAHLPQVTTLDQFWEDKQNGTAWKRPTKKYEPIHMPRNTHTGVVIGFFSVMMGFGLVWHIWAFALIGFIGVIAAFIARTFNRDIDYWVPAEEVERIENARYDLLEKQANLQATKAV